jgi:hypothetical protein
MRINSSDQTTLEQIGIFEGMKIHLQDEVKVNKRSKFNGNYFDTVSSFTSASSSANQAVVISSNT